MKLWNIAYSKGETMPAVKAAAGSAKRWGPLWGARAEDWARTEEKQTPTHEEVLRRCPVRPGDRVLDVGCGAGVFLRLAADAGALGFGIDASAELIELARRRVPEADLRVGDMEALPFEDDSFHLVTGLTSFFFAADMVAALREAGRVARPGAPVVIQVWGPPERNELEPMKEVMRRFMPPRPPDAPPQPELWRPGVVETIAEAAGLTSRSSFELAYSFSYTDEHELGRELMAPVGLAALAGDQEEEVRAEIVAALTPRRRGDGTYEIWNEFRFVVASA